MKGFVLVLLLGWGLALVFPPQKFVGWIRGKTA